MSNLMTREAIAPGIVKVNVWMPSPGNVGHASLSFRDVYASFRPLGAKKQDLMNVRERDPQFPPTYRWDRKHEGRDAEYRPKLDGLDIELMAGMWEGIKTSIGLPYDIVRLNGLTMTMMLLEQGSGISPSDEVGRGGLAIDEYTENPEQRRLLRARFGSMRIAMWTPTALLSYVEEIKKNKDKRGRP